MFKKEAVNEERGDGVERAGDGTGDGYGDERIKIHNYNAILLSILLDII